MYEEETHCGKLLLKKSESVDTFDPVTLTFDPGVLELLIGNQNAICPLFFEGGHTNWQKTDEFRLSPVKVLQTVVLTGRLPKD